VGNAWPTSGVPVWMKPSVPLPAEGGSRDVDGDERDEEEAAAPGDGGRPPPPGDHGRSRPQEPGRRTLPRCFRLRPREPGELNCN